MYYVGFLSDDSMFSILLERLSLLLLGSLGSRISWPDCYCPAFSFFLCFGILHFYIFVYHIYVCLYVYVCVYLCVSDFSICYQIPGDCSVQSNCFRNLLLMLFDWIRSVFDFVCFNIFFYFNFFSDLFDYFAGVVVVFLFFCFADLLLFSENFHFIFLFVCVFLSNTFCGLLILCLCKAAGDTRLVIKGIIEI